MQNAEESEKNYKNSVDDANFQQQKLESTKRDVLVELRQLIYQCDLTMKSVTVAYFQMMNNLLSPLPIQYRALSDNSNMYEEGQQFADFVKLQQSTCNQAMCPTYCFEAYRAENERYKYVSICTIMVWAERFGYTSLFHGSNEWEMRGTKSHLYYTEIMALVGGRDHGTSWWQRSWH